MFNLTRAKLINSLFLWLCCQLTWMLAVSAQGFEQASNSNGARAFNPNLTHFYQQPMSSGAAGVSARSAAGLHAQGDAANATRGGHSYTSYVSGSSVPGGYARGDLLHAFPGGPGAVSAAPLPMRRCVSAQQPMRRYSPSQQPIKHVQTCRYSQARAGAGTRTAVGSAATATTGRQQNWLRQPRLSKPVVAKVHKKITPTLSYGAAYAGGNRF